LRIISVGARPLDRRAITVLSLDALKRMADGQATKIIFPFELSTIVKQAAEYLGATVEAPEVPEGTELPPEDILGEVPSKEDLQATEEAARVPDIDVEKETRKEPRSLVKEEEERT
jgi:hypothetical protein